MKYKLSTPIRLLKASYYNAILVLVKILTGATISKIIAIYLGPSGLALLGNLKNLYDTSSSFTALGYKNGIIKYISENEKNKPKIRRISATIFQLSLLFSCIIGICLWFFSAYFSNYLFQTETYGYVLKIIGVGLPIWSFNLLIIYILNGLENYKKMVIVNSILSIINLLVSVVLIIKFGLVGGLLGNICAAFLVFIINMFVLGKERSLIFSLFEFKLFSFRVVKDMSAYFLMSIYSMVIVSVTILLIRGLIINKLGANDAGYWEAMTRISNFYLMFFISLTSFYLLPRLSKTNNLIVFKNELKGFYLLTIPMLLVGLTTIYFLRFFILNLLLNQDFLPTSNLFLWQLIGDFISVLAIALVKQFHAKRMVKAYIICNGSLNLLYLIFSYLFIDMYGINGVVKAYTLSYTIYLIIVILFVYNYFKSQLKC